MSDKDIDKAKRLFIEKGLTYGAIASKLGVSSRTVERWSSKGNWKSLRDAEEIVSESVASRISEELNEPVSPRAVKVRMSGDDDQQKLDDAIVDITADAATVASKSKEGAYATLARLIQSKQQLKMQHLDMEIKEIERDIKKADLKLKQNQLNPPTLEDWADQGARFTQSAAEMWEAIQAACKRALES